MNILDGTRVYLAGPVDHDSDRSNWRYEITKYLENLGIMVYNPLHKPWWMSQYTKVDPAEYYKSLYNESTVLDIDHTFIAMKNIRDVCMAAVSASDFIICHLPKTIFTFGTIVELNHTSVNNKPVFFHAPDGIPSTWALSQFSNSSTWKDRFFKNWDSLRERIEQINIGNVKIDPIEWYSISHKLTRSNSLDY